ncbi:MAG: transporter [Hydrogenophilaceae bacterium]|nr:transporter [Hydrogenophilaceae bacterium]
MAVSPAALAYHPLTTDDTGTQGAGGNQLEASYDYAMSKEAGVKAKERSVPLTYTRGLSDALDVYVGLPHVSVSETGSATERGWGNVAIGAKWRFYENEASKLSFAVRPEVVLPVSRSDEEKGLGSAETSYGVVFIATQETSFGELQANLEVSRTNYDLDQNRADNRENFYRLSVAPVWQVNEQWKLALDVGMQTNADVTKDRWMGYVELAAVYSPNEDLDFGLGLTRDVRDGAAESTAATLGVTWRFR